MTFSVTLLLGRLYAFSAYKFLPAFSSSIHFVFLLSSSFIFPNQDIFCQVSPIKFVLREHLRASRYLEIPSTNKSSHKNFTLAAYKRFSQLFFLHSFFCLFLSIFVASEKSLSCLMTRLGRVKSLRLVRKNIDSVCEIDG